MTPKAPPVDVRPLFKPLQGKLIELLKSLEVDQWGVQTVAKKWKVKDVVSHILDGQLRVLSIQRDGYFGEKPPQIDSYGDLVDWLNELNADWIRASRRISPEVLTMLLEDVGNLVSDYLTSLDPWDEAVFPVAWAGESMSYNWMHVAREYTEYWHHQQQIRDAVDKQDIMSKEYFYPVIDTFFQALPHTFKNVAAEEGTVVEAIVTSDAGGKWLLVKGIDSWMLDGSVETKPKASVKIPADISWVLFSKSIKPAEVIDRVEIKGDKELGMRVLEMVSVMA